MAIDQYLFLDARQHDVAFDGWLEAGDEKSMVAARVHTGNGPHGEGSGAVGFEPLDLG